MRYILSVILILITANAYALVDSSATTETSDLNTTLLGLMGNTIYFGQQLNLVGTNDTVEEDIFLLTNKYAYVHMEDYKQITNKRRARMIDHYEHGGVVSLSWHMNNWVTGGSDKDKTGDPVVNILPGGTHRSEYLEELDELAFFLNSLKDSSGTKVPVILRLYHECDGNFFWWGTDNATGPQFISLWQDMVDYLKDTKAVHNVLYCYSPLFSDADYTTRYPGDSYVDIIGIDKYTDAGVATIIDKYQDAYDQANSRQKVFAITEGMNDFTANQDDDFWTTYFDAILADDKAKNAAYVSFWASSQWGPDDDRSDSEDFITATTNTTIKLLQYGNTDIDGVTMSGLTIE